MPNVVKVGSHAVKRKRKIVEVAEMIMMRVVSINLPVQDDVMTDGGRSPSVALRGCASLVERGRRRRRVHAVFIMWNDLAAGRGEF